MRVFPDTNILVSAMVTRGLCEDLLRLLVQGHLRGQMELLIGASVMDELERILQDKLGADRETLALARALLAEGLKVPHGEHPATSIVPDPDDIPVLGCALAAKTDIFVTGDKALLNLKVVEGMAILSPRQMWERLSITSKGI